MIWALIGILFVVMATVTFISYNKKKLWSVDNRNCTRWNKIILIYFIDVSINFLYMIFIHVECNIHVQVNTKHYLYTYQPCNGYNHVGHIQ